MAGKLAERLVDRLLRDLRYAGRRLARNPGFSATAVVSLAIGIGASTAMFSIVNAVMIRELPLRAPEELLAVYVSSPDFEYNVFSYPEFEDLRRGTESVFSGVAGTRLVFSQVDHDGSVEMIPGQVVSGSFFGVLGIDVQLGRTLATADDVSPGAHPVVMLGHRYWQGRFGGDPGVVGTEIRLGGRPYTIVGVAPEDFPGSFRAIVPSFYAPHMMINALQPGETDQLEARSSHATFVTARLAPGVQLSQAQVAVDAVAEHMRELDLESWDSDSRFLLLPQEEIILYPPIDRFIRAASWLLMVVVGLVLVMACANLASFLLARTLDRRKEIAVRLALGARRRTIASQLLLETLVLGVIGGLAGVLLATLLLRLLLVLDLPLPLPIDLDLSLDGTVLAYSLAISLAAGFLLGLAPALQNMRCDMAATIRTEGAGGGRGAKQRLRNALVVFQVAMSLFLLLGAGLFARSMARIESVDPGFGTEPAALMTFLIPSTRYDQEQGQVLAQRLVDRFEQLPGVETAGLTDNLHLNSMSTQTIGVNVDGVDPPPGREAHTVDRATVDSGFFTATGIRIISGRGFDERDQEGGQAVAIISQAMAGRFWPDRDAVGQLIRLDGDEPDLLVVGVASDAKVRSLGEAPRAFVYRPLSQAYSSLLTAVAPTRADPDRTVLDLVAAAREIDPELSIWEAKTMSQHLAIMLLPARMSAAVLSAFAVLALTLVAVGLYGVVSYAVAQRRREVGIRMSLGADGAAVVRLLMSTGLRLVLIGGTIGLVLTLLLSRLLSGLLFEVSPLDPLTYLALPVVLVVVSSLATLAPAWAASRVDPATILRTE